MDYSDEQLIALANDVRTDAIVRTATEAKRVFNKEMNIEHRQPGKYGVVDPSEEIPRYHAFSNIPEHA